MANASLALSSGKGFCSLKSTMVMLEVAGFRLHCATACIAPRSSRTKTRLLLVGLVVAVVVFIARYFHPSALYTRMNLKLDTIAR